MMDMRIRILVVIAIIILMGTIVNLIRKKSLELRYALVWLLVGTGVLVLSIFPGLMEWLANVMGIFSVMNMLFFLGFCFSLAIIFTMTLAISRMSTRIKDLTQALALLERRERKDYHEEKSGM